MAFSPYTHLATFTGPGPQDSVAHLRDLRLGRGVRAGATQFFIAAVAPPNATTIPGSPKGWDKNRNEVLPNAIR